MSSINFTKSFLATVLVALISGSAYAGTMSFIDFGNAAGDTTADGFTTVTTTGSTTSDIAAVDCNGVVVPGTIDLTLAGGSFAGAGADYGGPYPAAVASQPVSALTDSIFIRGNAAGTNVVTFTLSDLDPSLTYDLLLYGARGNNGLETNFTATDNAGTVTGDISNVFNNATETVSFDGLVPDGTNTIVFTMTTPASTSSGGALNSLKITANPVPEPSTAGLLAFAFSGLLMVVRRRR